MELIYVATALAICVGGLVTSGDATWAFVTLVMVVVLGLYLSN